MMIKPKHIAFIMDGNGRWAEERGMERSAGHLAGAEAVRAVIISCVKHQIPYMTLYAFSTENWNRPKKEVNTLFKLFCDFVSKEVPLLLENNIKLSMLGDMSELPKPTQKALDYAIKKTANGTNLELILALNYSGTQEICHAARNSAIEILTKPENLIKIENTENKNLPALINDIFSKENYSENNIKENLFHPSVPSPDFIVRTGGEFRLSNFYLLQAAYAELYFCDTYWPDFQEDDFELALDAFAKRKRRFGKV